MEKVMRGSEGTAVPLATVYWSDLSRRDERVRNLPPGWESLA
jgi:hypothetical protein